MEAQLLAEMGVVLLVVMVERVVMEGMAEMQMEGMVEVGVLKSEDKK